MSSDRRPAKVRVVSAGPAQEAPAGTTPSRRRTDRPEETAAPAVAVAAPQRQGSSLLWATGALLLFLIGCVIGGALFVLSGLASAAQL